MDVMDLVDERKLENATNIAISGSRGFGGQREQKSRLLPA
jgi:hypothetical protein